MNIRNTSCCAVAEIEELRQHPTAREAMVAFCQQTLVKPVKFSDGTPARSGTVWSFFLFTGRVTGTYDGYRTTYAPEFAAFIREEGLGTVVETPETVNEAFHPGHACQAWLWTINQNAIKEWWKRNAMVPTVPQAPPPSMYVLDEGKKFVRRRTTQIEVK